MIRLLVLDVDGTMTDGGVYYDATGNELKKFAIKDGAGLVLARTAGIRVMICTGRECEAVRRRAGGRYSRRAPAPPARHPPGRPQSHTAPWPPDRSGRRHSRRHRPARSRFQP